MKIMMMKTNIKALTLLLFVALSFSSFAQKKWTLQECITYAQENNISIRQGENNLMLNEQDIISAKGAFLPSISGSAGHSLTLGNAEIFPGQFVDRTANSTNFGLSLSETIYNGSRIKNQYKQAQLTYDFNSVNLNQVKENMSLDVAVAYLNILMFKERLEIAKTQYEFSVKQLKQVKELVNAGVQPRANIFDSEATLSTDAQSVTSAENDYNLALLTLSQLLQLPFDGFEVEILELDDPSLEIMYDKIDDVLSYALENRGEVKMAEMMIESAELDTKIAKSGYYPSVTGGYSLGSNAFYTNLQDGEDTFFNQLNNQKSHFFNVGVNIPIFSGFRNDVNVAKSKIREENSKLTLQQTKLDLESNIQRAFTDARAALRSYEAAQKSFSSQQESFNNAQERYNIGAMNAFDLEQARVRFVNAQSSLLNAKYDFVFKTKVLDFYMGKQITL
jgi:outer membrane protein